jgi:outer membrane protein assembly factor BamD (BamD/ComL family)
MNSQGLRFTLVVVCLILLSWPGSPSGGESANKKSEQPPQGLARLGIRCSPPDSGASPTGSYKASWYLELAADAYGRGSWGYAFREYKKARLYHPEDPRDPEVLLMIADCALRELPALSDLMPADLFPEGTYGKRVLDYLNQTYGYYASASEGDSFWRYDMRALREFLRLYPHHDQADKVAYVLVKEDLMFAKYDPAVFMVRDERALACARQFIRRYEDILRRYPSTTLKPKINSDIALFRGYIKSGGLGPRPDNISNPW